MKVTIYIDIDDRIIGICRRIFRRRILQTLTIMILLSAGIAYTAGIQTNKPYPDFAPGDIIDHVRINENFDTLFKRVNDINTTEIPFISQDIDIMESDFNIRCSLIDKELNSVMNQAIPSGIIAMWGGKVTDIPSGWVLCDGNYQTPDLRGKFVVGAKDPSKANQGPGFITDMNDASPLHAHNVAHQHSGTTETKGKHNHIWARSTASNTWETYQSNDSVNINTFTLSQFTSLQKFDSASQEFLVFATNTQSDYYTDDVSSDHNHLYNSISDGGWVSDSAVNIPPYHALYYIMRKK